MENCNNYICRDICKISFNKGEIQSTTLFISTVPMYMDGQINIVMI